MLTREDLAVANWAVAGPPEPRLGLWDVSEHFHARHAEMDIAAALVARSSAFGIFAFENGDELIGELILRDASGEFDRNVARSPRRRRYRYSPTRRQSARHRSLAFASTVNDLAVVQTCDLLPKGNLNCEGLAEPATRSRCRTRRSQDCPGSSEYRSGTSCRR